MIVIENPEIVKKDDYRFRILWPSIPSITLDIDFEPLVAAIHPSIAQKGFSLLHWQARPKRTPEAPGRQWGCWYGGQYYSARTIEDIRSSFSQSIDLDESLIHTIPVSVICFQGLRPVYNDKGGERKLSLVKI